MNSAHSTNLLEHDHRFVWHPYSSTHSDVPVFAVKSATGAYITLEDGRQLIDGMSSWWCAIHGYNVPELNNAVHQQLATMAHIMFGGLTHAPAVRLCKKLVEITPEQLETVFLADSGSVSVEIAMKMAVQYWQARRQPGRQKFVSLRNGYHGDTMGAMSVCDPVTGMHTLFSDILAKNFFVPSPECCFGSACKAEHLMELQAVLEQHHEVIAALILEPVVQGAGGMKFYSADYLKQARALCEQYDILLIADEIATGFGRSGKLFACQHANISPDIMCVGKSLTGGYMTLAATLCTKKISDTISSNPPFVFMHGPTFMGNPLACAVALESIRLLEKSDWQAKVQAVEKLLCKGLDPCKQFDDVMDVRVLGAIGVVELKAAVNMPNIQQAFVDAGVWIRPFGKLIYLMPPYIIGEHELNTLTGAIFDILNNGKHR
ncbi:MAG: adenosylmethionine--8-amino-7-oxononanoate transaminase [Gammaproteobacteria bacterium]|jgi:adenosylmethionine-8-amino-7-oxononanoate aminotransferase|nr:adenosylmethionine--8-amino-7-oxononanoate transaminase [Gammaproteobacteria bacterium]